MGLLVALQVVFAGKGASAERLLACEPVDPNQYMSLTMAF
jgi:hypothetical protein